MSKMNGNQYSPNFIYEINQYWGNNAPFHIDERRIPLVMKVKVPVLGEVVATLAAYEPGAGS